MTNQVEIIYHKQISELRRRARDLLFSTNENEFIEAIAIMQISLLELVTEMMMEKRISENITYKEAVNSSCKWLKMAIEQRCSEVEKID